MTDDDRFIDRLSDYLDGDLDPAGRTEVDAHVASCASCRKTLDALREIRSRALSLPASEPASDLWPGIASAIGPRSRPGPTRARVLVAAAALLAVSAGSFAAGRFLPRAAAPLPPARYVLLLREPSGHLADSSESERAAIVNRYRSWARSLVPSGRMLGGAKLVDDAALSLLEGGATAPLDGRASGDAIGGYFVIGARDEEDALALARTCPHLAEGG